MRRCLNLFCFAILCFLCRVKPSSSASCGSRVTTAEDGELEEHGDGPGAFVVSASSWFGEAFSLICLKVNFGLAPVFVPVGISVRWSRELCSGAVPVVIGGPVRRGEQSIFEKIFG